MTIELDLSAPEALDWLNADATDVWAGMSDDERRNRAREAQARALADWVDGDLAPDEAGDLIAALDEAERRDARRAALERDGDADYLDRVAAEIAGRVGLDG